MVKERVRKTRLDAVALVAGTVVLLSSVLLTFFLSSYDLEKQSARKAEISVTHVNSLLQKTQRVAHTVLALSGRECTQRLKSDLQREVIVTSNIRTVSLVSNGRVYCSSVYGDTVERDRPSIFMDNSLLLMKGSRLAENIPVVVFRENSPDRKKAVLVEIDGYFISNIMYMAESKLPAYFLIGDLY
ncbi:TPA: CSS-motif domain-containing protein, partial [Salmonella enterica subsp. diarizonae serovar 61:l,v:z35]